MTKDEFRKRWRTKLAAMALFGVVSDTRDNVLHRAAHALDIPANVDSMLDMMYEDMNPPVPKPPPSVNGPLPARKA